MVTTNFFQNSITSALELEIVLVYNATDEAEQNGDDEKAGAADFCGCIALVFLAEAHVAMAVTLSHTGMIYHEKVHVKVISACPPDLVMF